MKKVSGKQLPYDVEIEVMSVKDNCRLGHFVGEKFLIKSMKVENKMCIELLANLLPWVHILAFGGEVPWDKENGIVTRVCPDTGNEVMVKMRAIK